MEAERGVWVGEVVLCISLMSSVCHAKSVYVIGDTDLGKIITYKVGDNELIWQKESAFSTWGAIDIAVAESLTGTHLFVTYEGQAFIRVIDAKTMELLDDVILPHAANLAGITYDAQRHNVYTVDRFSNRLYSYTWDARNLSLTPNFAEPYYIELQNLNPFGGAVEIALDWINDYVYVSDRSDVIKYYNVTDFSYAGGIQTSLQEILGVAVNPESQILYFGSMDAYGQQWKYLSSYDLTASDPNDAQSNEPVGASICGITCDAESGYVYATTFSDGSNGHEDSVLMFSPYEPNNPSDPNLALVWDSPRTGSPSGIVFSEEDYKPPGLSVIKHDDISGCVYPEDFVVYTIAVYSPEGEQTNVVVTDILPYEADFISADPNTGTYYPDDHVYIWNIETLFDPNDLPPDPNSYMTITVQVNDGAEPTGQMVNKVIAESDTAYGTAEERTDICCWGPDVIYVDKDALWQRIAFMGLTFASGYNNGTSWENAYRDLNDALARAAKGCGSEIWVAEGTYHPGTTPGNRYDVPDGVEIYGGFCGNETDPNQRNPAQYKTVLSGYIGENDYGLVYRNNTVVEMGNNSVLDGFTVEEGGLQGINASDVSSNVLNCVIKENTQWGINCEDGNLTVKWCEIYSNGYQGIYHEGNNYSLIVENCKLYDNQNDGIRTDFSFSTIFNSLIYQNGFGSTAYNTYYGINLVNPSSSPTIRNNTIVQNINEGIRFVGSHAPDIVNCIVYYNNNDGTQLAGMDPEDAASYCCIADCNEVYGNINVNPKFVYNTEPYGYYHIKYESPCRNGGDSGSYTSETDMDGEPRVADDGVGIVDIGADEVDCEDTWHENDWTHDGVINYEDFSIFAKGWLSRDPNDPSIITDPNYSSDPDYAEPQTLAQWEQAWFPWGKTSDLDDDLNVDLYDLEIFCDQNPQNWLWMACWRENYMAMYGMMSGGEGMQVALPIQEFLSMQSAYETSSYIEKTEPVYEAESVIQILEFLYGLLETETDNTDTILEIIAVLEEWLEEIDLK